MAKPPKDPTPRPAPQLYLVTPPVGAADRFAAALKAAVGAADVAAVLLRLEPAGDAQALGTIGLEVLRDRALGAVGGELTSNPLVRKLRSLPLPVVGRIAHDRLLLDLRCLDDAAPFTSQLPALREALGMGPLHA